MCCAIVTLIFSGGSFAEQAFPAPQVESSKSRFNIADTFNYLLFDQHRDQRIEQQEPAAIDLMPLFYKLKNLPYNGEKWRSSTPDDVEIEAHEEGLEIEMKWQF
ncbi:hypothetical protein SIN8267_02025 [Sinobacterium norvegicum]|uniref:Uncharacterized protein n=2 Tax=Sinobacterium norvegicum TaxID=1641715 RepID=A0ABM9AFD8_9GAMM|nr:hypothetical protein SIN8267_02025 [Sinobacterium norvegicum]